MWKKFKVADKFDHFFSKYSPNNYLRFFIVVVAFEAFMFHLVNIIADTKENVKAAEINGLKITLSQGLNI